MSEPRVGLTFGISSGADLMLPERHPACRWREAQLGRSYRGYVETVSSLKMPHNKALQPTDNPLRVLSAAELGRYES